jgi:hypothetical protein
VGHLPKDIIAEKEKSEDRSQKTEVDALKAKQQFGI